MESLEKKSNPYLKFSLFFIIIAPFIFAEFFHEKVTFVQYGDGFRQHIIAMMYYGEFLRSLLTGNLIQWSFNIGEGGDVFQALNFYALGDPFTLLSVFFPKNRMYICFTLISLLKLYSAGLAFIYLCRYTKVKSQVGTLAGALVYCFSYYAVFQASNHPFFLNPLIYFPLMIVGIQKLVREHRGVLFTLVVTISALSNFYFFYITVLLTVLYVAMFLVNEFGRDYRAIFKSVGLLFCHALLGVAMAAVLLAPVIYFFLSDPRAQAQSARLFYPLRFYIKLPLFFFIPKEENSLYMGYSCVIYLAIFSLFMKRKSMLLKVMVIICAFFALIPLFSQVLNGLNHAEQRWCWALVLVSSYILALQWDDLLEMGRKTILINLCLLLLLFTVFHIGYPKGYHIAISFFHIALFAVLWLLYRFPVKVRARGVIAVAILALAVNSNYLFSDLRYVTPEICRELTDNEISKIKEMDSATFYRFSDDTRMANMNLVNDLSSPSSYWSLTNEHTQQYRSLLCPMKNHEAHDLTDYDSRAILESLSGVKYYITKNRCNVPYGFKPTAIENVYRNDNVLPFGYTYDRFISRADFEKMGFAKRQIALLDGVVLEAGMGLSEAKIECGERSVPFAVDCSEGALYKEGKIIISEEGASVKLKFKGLPESENYICFKGLDYSSDDYIYTYDMKANLTQGLSPKYIEYFDINFTCSDGGEKSFTHWLPIYNYYQNIHDFFFNLGYSEVGESSLTMTFDRSGEYTFDSLKVVCQPMKDIPSKLSALKRDSLKDVKFGTNRVSGNISLSERKALLLSIPYSKGWKATVDGRPAELICANIMNMALVLEPGEHIIELHYSTPFLKLGAIISVIAILIFLTMNFTALSGCRRARKVCSGKRSS